MLDLLLYADDLESLEFGPPGRRGMHTSDLLLLVSPGTRGARYFESRPHSENGGRLQRPDVGVEGDILLSFYTDAKAEGGKAWIGGFLEINPEVTRDWAPWSLHQDGYQESDCRVGASGYVGWC